MRHYPLSGSPFRAGHDFISTPHWLRSGAQIPFSISNVLGIVTPTYSARAPCTLDESRRETQRPAAGKWSGRNSAMSASLIGRLGSSTFRLSAAAVSMSLTGSCFSSESAPRPFHHGIRGRGRAIFGAALPSDERQVQADMRTHLIHRPARDIIPPLGGVRVSSYRV
jgi:hypothetical protein